VWQPHQQVHSLRIRQVHNMISKPDFFTAWTEPESAANSQYQPVFPYNHATQTTSGHSFEMDDTPTRERVRLQHRSNTFIEMHPNGDEVHKIIGDGYEIILQDKNMLVQGKLNITVVGDANFWIQGDKIEQVDGNVEQHIKGNFTQTVEGMATYSSQGDTRIVAGGIGTSGLKVTAPVTSITGTNMSVNADFVAEKITSRGRIDAVTGVSAGPLGFVTMTGGVSVGIPAAVPTEINAIGPINSLVSMSAPLGQFAVMQAVWAYDTVNLSMYNSHIHISPKGPTGPPIPEEIGA